MFYFFSLPLAVYGLLPFLTIFRSVYSYLQKSSLTFWLNFHWTCESIKNYYLNNTDCLTHEHSILVHIFDFFHQLFFNFLHENSVHILLALCLNISVWEYYKWYLKVFLILLFHCCCVGKKLTFINWSYILKLAILAY